MKSKKLLMAILAGLGLILTTVGITVAWFSYVKNGTQENTITAGSVNFHYKEESRTINVDDMMPMTDIQGKSQTDWFDFTITASTAPALDIPYYITVRSTADSDVEMADIVKVYLTKVDNSGNETEVLLSGVSNLGTYTHNSLTIPLTEKLLHSDKVYAGDTNYEQKYRLRMWISDDAEFIIQESGQPDVYPYDGMSYALTVNVYSSGEEINSAQAEIRKNVNINDITIGANVTTSDTNTFIDTVYIEPGQSSVSKQITVNTANPNAIVTVENLTALGDIEKNITRLASTHTINVVMGTNTYKITVTSENRKLTKEYTLVITGQRSIFNVVFNGNGATSGVMSEQTFTVGVEQSLTANTYLRTDHNFLGWSESSSATTPTYTDGQIVSDLTTGGNTITLYAVWLSNVTSFDVDDGYTKTYTAPSTGYYKLEAWGAQGGHASGGLQGYGGYAVGVAYLSANTTLHITLGGQGSACNTTKGYCSTSGGYNGGGNAYYDGQAAAGGGGATHIATDYLGTGLLSNYINDTDKLLIVAGGGGGAGYANNAAAIGGNGGGISGTTGNSNNNGYGTTHSGTGGSQSIGGVPNSFTIGNGSFGQGGQHTAVIACATCANNGGGGGYYGGGASTRGHNGGGGGSGYIANLISINNITKHMYCYNCTTSPSTSPDTYTISEGITSCHNSVATADCAKEGNGYVRITYLGNN